MAVAMDCDIYCTQSCPENAGHPTRDEFHLTSEAPANVHVFRLWVPLGLPLEPRHSDPRITQLRFCLSVDHSRIKLHQEDNDYINASLIKMEEAQRSYILTQVTGGLDCFSCPLKSLRALCVHIR